MRSEEYNKLKITPLHPRKCRNIPKVKKFTSGRIITQQQRNAQ